MSAYAYAYVKVWTSPKKALIINIALRLRMSVYAYAYVKVWTIP